MRECHRLIFLPLEHSIPIKNITKLNKTKSLQDHMANENHGFVVQDDFQVHQKTLPGNEPVNILLNTTKKKSLKELYELCNIIGKPYIINK